jgi:drug/metabolite transporter (DMT)-like permease
VAVILTVVANILITIDSNFKFKINKGLVLSLITSLCLGFAWTFDKVVSPNFSVSFYTFMAFIFLEIIKEELNGKKFLSIMILGFTNAVGYFMMISAMGTGEVSKVVLIISTAAIITVFLAIFILKEKEGAFKKIIATILVVIATILLAL